MNPLKSLIFCYLAVLFLSVLWKKDETIRLSLLVSLLLGLLFSVIVFGAHHLLLVLGFVFVIFSVFVLTALGGQKHL